MGGLESRTDFDPVQRGEPLAGSPPEDRGGVAAMAVVLGALCLGARLGRALAAYDRPRADQTAACGAHDRPDRGHDPGLWQRLPAWTCRLARDHRRAGQADL